MVKEKSDSKKWWKWWYSGCWNQNIYIVLTIISAIILVASIIFLSTMTLPTDSDPKRKEVMEALKKYRIEIMITLISIFVVTFVVDNLILVWYCNMKTKGATSVLWTLFLWFVLLPGINSMLSSILMLTILKDLIVELQQIENKYKIMEIQPAQ